MIQTVASLAQNMRKSSSMGTWLQMTDTDAFRLVRRQSTDAFRLVRRQSFFSNSHMNDEICIGKQRLLLFKFFKTKKIQRPRIFIIISLPVDHKKELNLDCINK